MKKIIITAGIVALIIINAHAQIITTVAGNGTAGYSGDAGQATVAELNSPQGVAIDATGNLYITDTGNNRIRKVSTAGVITTIAGTGTAGYSGDGGQATDAELNAPAELMVDAAGNLYINNTNVIRKVNTTGIITTIAGNGTQGFSGDVGQATAAELYYPQGIAIDATGNMYIVDYGNNRLRKINTAGIITTIAGTGGYSGDGGQATAAKLNGPIAVAVDAVGNLYITDSGNNRVRIISTAGIITTFAGNGTGGFSGDGGQAIIAELNYPIALATDATGNLYIADYDDNRIRIVNTAGIISTIAGNGTSGYSGDCGQAAAAELDSPIGITINTAGNLYIADAGNNCIREIGNTCNTTGIKLITNANEQINIYPNPGNGSFIIEPNSTGKQTMQVYDINGNMVLSQIINGKTSIDASILNEGVYNLSIISSEGIINKRVVIVK